MENEAIKLIKEIHKIVSAPMVKILNDVRRLELQIEQLTENNTDTKLKLRQIHAIFKNLQELVVFNPTSKQVSDLRFKLDLMDKLFYGLGL